MPNFDTVRKYMQKTNQLKARQYEQFDTEHKYISQ